MKIASHLWQSPLGVFYFRETEQKNGKQTSRRISLRTKDPIQAKCKAVQLLATLAFNNSTMSKLDKFEIAVSNGNLSFKTDPDKPDDIIHLGKFVTENKEILKELIGAQGVVQPQAKITAPAHHSAQYSATYASLIPKYEERKKREIAKKTLYQYTQIIKKFQEWAESREGYKPLLMNQIDKKVVSLYVDYLQANSFSNQNIENKYMRALNTFLITPLAQASFQTYLPLAVGIS